MLTSNNINFKVRPILLKTYALNVSFKYYEKKKHLKCGESERETRSSQMNSTKNDPHIETEEFYNALCEGWCKG